MEAEFYSHAFLGDLLAHSGLPSNATLSFQSDEAGCLRAGAGGPSSAVPGAGPSDGLGPVGRNFSFPSYTENPTQDLEHARQAVCC